ncbi:UNVERIFIED_CONTAM: hypothetical protein Slati_3738700 [Sesamum latifolium]|uniref:DUF4283 domain-containing protein n=1 Tax=Sesamum latifolium TaxID=2727402 RepID=A0AAW2U2F4_9LAMI
MNSQVTLSYLSHITHTNDSHAHVSSPTADDPNRDGDDGNAPGPREGTQSIESDTVEARIQSEFNFSDFYSLATRVLDRNESSLDKLVSLKKRWERRFPEPAIVRRLIPRFPSRLTFLPRRSVAQPVNEGVDTGLHNLGNSQIPKSGKSIHCSPTEETSQIQDSQERVTDSINLENPSTPELFVGNVKINLAKIDNIADAFLNSSRKTLRYIPPQNQKDEIIIRPTTAMVEQGSKQWQSTAVGYFLGKKPYFPQLEAFAKTNWKGLQQVSATTNRFYFFQFKTLAFMEEVIEEGPWLFQGQPVVLQAWEQGMSLRRQKHLQIPVWIRIRHLPMEYWTEDGLSAVASGIGTPLYMDKITKTCSRLDFARVCVMLDYQSKLLKHLIVLNPILREGKEMPMKVDIEYEWLPLCCKQCCSLGHNAIACPDTRLKKQSVPVTVFVQKKQSTSIDSTKKREEVEATKKQVGDDVHPCPNSHSGEKVDSIPATYNSSTSNPPGSVKIDE